MQHAPALAHVPCTIGPWSRLVTKYQVLARLNKGSLFSSSCLVVSYVTYGKVSESLPFVPLISPPLIPSCTTLSLVLVRGEAILRIVLSQFPPDYM